MNREMLNSPFRVAVVQAASVFMDRDATVDKACELILEAGRNGARLVAFPESFIPTYPHWVWSVPAGDEGILSELYAEFVANAVMIPSDPLDKICRIARRAKTYVVLGLSERNVQASGASLFDTLVFIDGHCNIRGKHRKLVPTGGERLVWAPGDGSTLDVYPSPFAQIGGLLGWENYMPLARYALYAWGVQIYVAATWHGGETWLATLRHIAKEGHLFVLGACSLLRQDAIPERYAHKQNFYSTSGEWVNQGGSVIVNPDGKFIAGPAYMKEEILYAEISANDLRGAIWMLDVAGHHARPDVFQLNVNRAPQRMIQADEARAESKSAEPDLSEQRPRGI